jgi:hypothetical protein
MTDIEGERTPQLSTRATFGLQISILVLLLAASSAPTPLYSVFQAEWGFSPITITVVFGVYAVAVLAALLTVGKLSDHIGRRPVLIAALALQVLALLVFATAGNVTALLVARIVQGLSTGAAVGALGAGLLDIDKVKARSQTAWLRSPAPRSAHSSQVYSCSTSRTRLTSSSWFCLQRSSSSRSAWCSCPRRRHRRPAHSHRCDRPSVCLR